MTIDGGAVHISLNITMHCNPEDVTPYPIYISIDFQYWRGFPTYRRLVFL